MMISLYAHILVPLLAIFILVLLMAVLKNKLWRIFAALLLSFYIFGSGMKFGDFLGSTQLLLEHHRNFVRLFDYYVAFIEKDDAPGLVRGIFIFRDKMGIALLEERSLGGVIDEVQMVLQRDREDVLPQEQKGAQNGD